MEVASITSLSGVPTIAKRIGKTENQNQQPLNGNTGTESCSGSELASLEKTGKNFGKELQPRVLLFLCTAEFGLWHTLPGHEVLHTRRNALLF